MTKAIFIKKKLLSVLDGQNKVRTESELGIILLRHFLEIFEQKLSYEVDI